MNWSLSTDAEEELDHAATHYQDQASIAVADAFLHEFERAASLIAEYLGLGTPASRGRRLMLLRRFPFSLLYRVEGANTVTRTVSYDVAEHLRTPEERAAYLGAWLDEAPDDAAGLARALGDIARAKYMTTVAATGRTV